MLLLVREGISKCILVYTSSCGTSVSKVLGLRVHSLPSLTCVICGQEGVLLSGLRVRSVTVNKSWLVRPWVECKGTIFLLSHLLSTIQPLRQIVQRGFITALQLHLSMYALGNNLECGAEREGNTYSSAASEEFPSAWVISNAFCSLSIQLSFGLLIEIPF